MNNSTIVKIYYKPTCGYSMRAMDLLERKKNINIEKVDITNNADLKEQMMGKSSGRTTVPQIFINEEHIGGCDDLLMLESSNKLDSKLYGK